MNLRVPPGMPTGTTIARASPAFKAQQEFLNQFGAGSPLEQPDLNMAATDAAVLQRQTLKRSGRRVDGPACFAASTMQQSITEKHMVKALNVSLDKIRAGQLGADDSRLAELAHRTTVIHKLYPHEWFDGYMVVENEDGTVTTYFGLAVQSTQRYRADRPGSHPGSAARRAMLLPRRCMYKLQAAASKLNQPMVLISRSVVVGSAGKVKAQLQAQPGAATGAEAAAAMALDVEEVDADSTEPLHLLLEEAEEAEEAETAAESVGEVGEEDGEPEPHQQQLQQQQAQAESEGDAAGSDEEDAQGEVYFCDADLEPALKRCVNMDQAAIALLNLVLQGEIDPLPTDRCEAAGTRKPHLVLNAAQAVGAKSLAACNDILAPVVAAEGGHAEPCSHEAMAYGELVGMPPGWEAPLDQSLQLHMRALYGRDISLPALVRQLQRCTDSNVLPQPVQRMVAAANALHEGHLPAGGLEELRTIFSPGRMCLEGQVAQCAAEAAEEAGGPQQPQQEARVTRTGTKRPHADDGGSSQANRKKSKEWTTEVDVALLHLAHTQTDPSGGTIIVQGKQCLDFDKLAKDMSALPGQPKRTVPAVKGRLRSLVGTSSADRNAIRTTLDSLTASSAAAIAAAGGGSSDSAFEEAAAEPAAPAAPAAGPLAPFKPIPTAHAVFSMDGLDTQFVRVASIGQSGTASLTYAVAGAQYAMAFEQTLRRTQLIVVHNPVTGAAYCATPLEFHYRGLLGRTNGEAARGQLIVSEDSLAPFSITPLLGDMAALRAYLLPRLLGVSNQRLVRSLLSDLDLCASKAVVVAAHRTGGGPFRRGWSVGLMVNGETVYDNWVKVQEEARPALAPVLQDAFASGMLTPTTAWSSWCRDRYAHGLEGQETAKDSTYVNALRFQGGDVDTMAKLKAGRARFVALVEDEGLKPTFRVRPDDNWAWVAKVEKHVPGFTAVVEQVRDELRAQGVEVTSQNMHTLWKEVKDAYNKRTKGSYELRKLAS